MFCNIYRLHYFCIVLTGSEYGKTGLLSPAIFDSYHLELIFKILFEIINTGIIPRTLGFWGLPQQMFGKLTLLLCFHFLNLIFYLLYQLLHVGISVECRSAVARPRIDQCAATRETLRGRLQGILHCYTSCLSH